MQKIILFILCLLIISACAGQSTVDEKFTLKKASYNDLTGWEDDNHNEALESFKKSCGRLKINPQGLKHMPGATNSTARDWLKICSKISSKTDAKTFFETNFTPYLASKGSNKKALFTGYFETELNGSREKKAPYLYPIYKLPPDLKTGEKYFTRAEINNGALEGKRLEIAWVDDPIRLFFLHVQGSGRIKMDDGSVVHVNFAGKNNQEYVSIGKYLVGQNEIEEKNSSKAIIEEWLHKHPAEINNVLEKNPSYIFFRETGGEGPIGGQGVTLTPMRSVAIDSSIMNYGTPVWVDTVLSGQGLQNGASLLQKLMIAQDTGSAIKGPLRLDIFFGFGEDAERMAGYQNSPGRYFLLLPKK